MGAVATKRVSGWSGVQWEDFRAGVPHTKGAVTKKKKKEKAVRPTKTKPLFRTLSFEKHLVPSHHLCRIEIPVTLAYTYSNLPPLSLHVQYHPPWCNRIFPFALLFRYTPADFKCGNWESTCDLEQTFSSTTYLTFLTASDSIDPT